MLLDGSYDGSNFSRRQLLRSGALIGGGFALDGLLPAWARSETHGLAKPLPTVSGTDIALAIGHTPFAVDGRTGHAITINGTVPAPLVRLKEGQKVRIAVTNDLDEDTSIHWHGLILPFQMDGVPGVSFPGIKPRSTFVYEFHGRPVGHLLVSQPLGSPGADGPLRPDRDRSGRPRSRGFRPRICRRAVRLELHCTRTRSFES